MTEPNAPLQALQTLPELHTQAIISKRLVVTAAQRQHLMKRLDGTDQPKTILVALMAGLKCSDFESN